PALLRAAAADAPHADAFRYRDERIAYGDWVALSERLAGGLAARGIRRGDVVALLLPSTPLYPVAYMAAARLGAGTTGINVRYRRAEIEHVLRRSGAALLVGVESWHDADFRNTVDPLRAGIPSLPDIAWIGADALRASTAAVVDTLAADMPAVPRVDVAPDDPAAIIFTSG